MQQQFAGTDRVEVAAGELVGRHVHAEQPDLAVVDAGVAVLEVGATVADRLHLGALEHDPALVGFEHEVVVAGLAIRDNDPVAAVRHKDRRYPPTRDGDRVDGEWVRLVRRAALRHVRARQHRDRACVRAGARVRRLVLGVPRDEARHGAAPDLPAARGGRVAPRARGRSSLRRLHPRAHVRAVRRRRLRAAPR